MAHDKHTWTTGDTISAALLNAIETDLAATPAFSDLAPVATSGNYIDLTNQPPLAPVATSGLYSDISGTPALAPVATTGHYSDLTGAPSIPAAYTDEQVRDVIGAALVAGANVSITVNDAADSITIASTGGGTVTTTASATDGDFGVVPLDSFTGADDDTKLTNALAAVAADTYKRTILLTNRKYNFATANRSAFSGLRIQGPAGYSNADKGAGFMSGEVHLTTTGPWFHNNNTNVFDASFRGLAFTGGSNATVLGQSGSSTSWWRLHMRDISASGLRSVLGTVSTPILITGAFIDGFWEVNNSYNTAFHLSGSDNRLFMSGGFLDSDPSFNTAGSAGGQAHLWCDGLENTVIGPLYITCESLWTGVKIDGPTFGSTSSNQGGPIVFNGLHIEGRNAGAGSNGAVVRQNGGIARFRDCNFHYGMISPTTPGRTPTDAGMIHHADGQLLVSGATYDRATGVAQTVPLVYTASAGKCVVNGIQTESRGGAWTALPVVAIKSGNTENRITDGTVSLASI